MTSSMRLSSEGFDVLHERAKGFGLPPIWTPRECSPSGWATPAPPDRQKCIRE